MITVKIRKLREDVKAPKYANPGDGGMDVFSLEDYNLKPGERKTFGLGFQAQFPEGHIAHVWDKSGLASNHGITTLGGAIDASYRGEYKIILINTSNKDYEIKKGDKIAQLVITPIINAKIEETTQEL